MPWKKTPPSPSPPAPAEPARQRRDVELRLYGLNAVRAVFARRPQSIRKLYLAEARIPQLQPLLKWCVANRVGYRVVEQDDLQKLAASAHHDDAMAQADQFHQFGRYDDDTTPLAGEALDQEVNVAFGTNIDAACRFVKYDHFRIGV